MANVYRHHAVETPSLKAKAEKKLPSSIAA
jgi:hypothetical protein